MLCASSQCIYFHSPPLVIFIWAEWEWTKSSNLCSQTVWSVGKYLENQTQFAFRLRKETHRSQMRMKLEKFWRPELCLSFDSAWRNFLIISTRNVNEIFMISFSLCLLPRKSDGKLIICEAINSKSSCQMFLLVLVANFFTQKWNSSPKMCFQTWKTLRLLASCGGKRQRARICLAWHSSHLMVSMMTY